MLAQRAIGVKSTCLQHSVLEGFHAISRMVVCRLLTRGRLRRTCSGARPHLVLFLADDLSWADCPIYGATDIQMPNLERLARMA